MQSPKLYATIFIVGAISDLATNFATRNSTTGVAGGLHSFYETASPVKTALLAGVTFVAVFFVSDFIYSKFIE